MQFTDEILVVIEKSSRYTGYTAMIGMRQISSMH